MLCSCVNNLYNQSYTSISSKKTTALLEKKAYAETSKLPRLTSLCEAVEAAICFLVSRHQLLHASLHRDAYGAATSSTGDSTKPLDESSKIISETRDGWRQLSTASGASSTGRAGSLRGLEPGRLFGRGAGRRRAGCRGPFL